VFAWRWVRSAASVVMLVMREMALTAIIGVAWRCLPRCACRGLLTSQLYGFNPETRSPSSQCVLATALMVALAAAIRHAGPRPSIP